MTAAARSLLSTRASGTVEQIAVRLSMTRAGATGVVLKRDHVEYGMLKADDGRLILFVPPDTVRSMTLLGIGAGLGFNPVLMAGTSDVAQHESGLASGVLNTSFMMGGSLGLAILASLAAFRTGMLTDSGSTQIMALLGGYHLAFIVGACFALLAAVIGAIFLNSPSLRNNAKDLIVG